MIHSNDLALACLMHQLLNALPTTVTQPVVSLHVLAVFASASEASHHHPLLL
jgi:hypothetical protein